MQLMLPSKTSTFREMKRSPRKSATNPKVGPRYPSKVIAEIPVYQVLHAFEMTRADLDLLGQPQVMKN
jgi:hypothetical protein